MKRLFSRRALGWVATCLPLGASIGAAAQDWPATSPRRPIRIVVGFGAGGIADILARTLAAELPDIIGQQIIVENRAGGSGMLAAGMVAGSPPDGSTLTIGGAGPHLVGPPMNPNIRYDTMRDFTHIAMIAGDTYMLASKAGTELRSFADLVRLARGREVTCGTPGIGSQGHLMLEAINRAAGIRLLLVPYAATSQNIQNLLGGDVALALQPTTAIGELVREGSIAPLAVTSTARNPAFANVPTFAELGYPGVQGMSWFWLAGPKDMPADIVAALSRSVRRIMALARVRDQLARSGLVTMDLGLEETRRFIAGEVAHWGAIVRAAQLTIQ